MHALLALLLTLAPGPAPAAAPAPAGQERDFVELQVRVLSLQHGTAIVDHGSNDGLAIGDRVRFLPRAGAQVEGTIEALTERSSVVRFDDPSFAPGPGTRGSVRLPWSRRTKDAARAAPVEPAAGTPPAPEVAPPQETPLAPEHPPWKERRDEWSAREPLLARLEPVRPEQRARSVHGRLYSIADTILVNQDHRRDWLYRAGGDVTYDNVSGRADTLHVGAELNYRSTVVPDGQDEHGFTLRLARLSYVRGGTRFAPERWEFGRFLHNGMPEFGVLDGVEWVRRTESGDRYGASFGFLPEPDPDFDTGADLQVAGFYRWLSDASEELSASLGFQKTFHHLAADRDLLVTNLRYLPPRGWTLYGTAWLDFYGSGEDTKPFVEPTQVYLASGRRFAGGSTLELVYSHLAFPALERHEFVPVDDAGLEDDHRERLALESRLAMARHFTFDGGVGLWTDEDESGFDGEAGFAVDGIGGNGYASLAAFATRGRFVTSLGARLGFGLALDASRFGLDYEIGANRLDGFSADNDDLPQHRLRLSGDLVGATGWSLALHAEGLLFDDEHALSAGFHLQKSF
jgi:hypothetical protein